MPDRHTREQRSRNMASIRKFGNQSTEVRLAALFRQRRIKGWRRHLPLPGRPDFTFLKERLVVFVDGCFWHGCPRCRWLPASNTAYWDGKLALNRSRDRTANRSLRKRGFIVLRVWEHSLRRFPERVLIRVSRVLEAARAGLD